MIAPVDVSRLSCLTLRPATPDDQKAIVALVASERLNPTGLNWSCFTLAIMKGSLVGAVQMRRHRDGARELGSLVVVRPERGQGIAARLINSVLAGTSGPVHVITSQHHAWRWARWGFTPIAVQEASRSVRLNYCLGRMGRVLSFLRGQPPRHLAILRRPDAVGANVFRVLAGVSQAGWSAHAAPPEHGVPPMSAMLPLQPITSVPAVRRLTTSDLPDALALQREVSASVPDGFLRGKTESQLHDYLRGLVGAAYGVFEGGALQALGLLRLPGPGHPNVGTAFPRVGESDWPLHTAVLEHDLVAPGARGRGLQRALIDARIAAARRAGMRWLCAGVQLANTASCRNLLSQGLVIVEGRFSPEPSLLALLLPLDVPGLESCAARQAWVLADDAAGHEKALRAGYLGVRAAMGGTVLYQRELIHGEADGGLADVPPALPDGFTSLRCPARP